MIIDPPLSKLINSGIIIDPPVSKLIDSGKTIDSKIHFKEMSLSRNSTSFNSTS